MADPLAIYLHDHLAGARFAVNLLADLREQKLNSEVAECAAQLLPEIERDREALEGLAKAIGADAHTLKDIGAWIAQKAGRAKFTLSEPLGVFEAVEFLALGVQGKIALWNALETVRRFDIRLTGLDLVWLLVRARDQHARLESLRVKLAAETLRVAAQ
jgi:hypothetical protein